MSHRDRYIRFINESETIQNWLKNAPSQLLDYDVVRDRFDGLLRIRILLKNAYLFEDEAEENEEEGLIDKTDKQDYQKWINKKWNLLFFLTYFYSLFLFKNNVRT